MKRWSKLQKQIHAVVDPHLRFQIQCRVYSMDSTYGRTGLPRYWITLGSETIWDYPKNFIDKPHPARTPPSWYPYGSDISAISELLRDYLDTPRNQLLSKQFDNDHWGLINILRAADRRLGSRQWSRMQKKMHNVAALKILEARITQKYLETTIQCVR